MVPYGTTAAVETTRVISALMHDCCERFVFFLVVSVKYFGNRLESSSTSHFLALSSLQKSKHCREVDAIDNSLRYHRIVSSRRLMGIMRDRAIRVSKRAGVAGCIVC